MSDVAAPAREGRRERKRRETRGRIVETAMGLFLRRGFAMVTVDEIAEAADVSKRSFFDYFPTKEDLFDAWQDRFAEALAAAVEARPKAESAVQAVERALTETLVTTATAESFAITRIIRESPSLRGRDQLKYLAVESAVTAALSARDPKLSLLRAQLVAAVAVSALRVGVEAWHATDGLRETAMLSFTQAVFRDLWAELGKRG